MRLATKGCRISSSIPAFTHRSSATSAAQLSDSTEESRRLDMPATPRRRWFQFSLAEWLILTTLLGVAWWQCVHPVPGFRYYPSQADICEIAIASAAIIGLWLIGSITVRSLVRHRQQVPDSIGDKP